MGDGIVGLGGGDRLFEAPQLEHEAFVAVPNECYDHCRKLSGHIGELAIATLGDQQSSSADHYIRAIVCDKYPGLLRSCRAVALRGIQEDRGVLSSNIYFSSSRYGSRYWSDDALMNVASEANGQLTIM